MTWKVQQQVEWRRSKVLEYLSQGLNQKEIATKLQVDESTISRDIAYLKEQARYNIKNYIEDRLPLEFEKCLAALNAVRKNAWKVAEESTNGKLKIQALSLVKESTSTTMDMLTNAAVVDDAIRLVEDAAGIAAGAGERAKAKESASSSESQKASKSRKGNLNDIQRPKKEDPVIGAGRTATTNKVF